MRLPCLFFCSVLLPRFKIVNGADHFENVHRGTDIVHNILHLLIGHRTFIQRIGTQNGPFFSLEIFREFFKPYYRQLIEKAHALGTHFWLHSCGNIEPFLEDFIEIGLDVIHPIQKNTMDEETIARKYGGRICILSGFDVQYLMAFGSPDEVKEEVARLRRIFTRQDGRFMLTMGNGSTSDWKKENLEALYEASLP